MEKIPYLKHLHAISDDATLYYVLDDPIRSSTWLFVQHMTVEDETTNFDNIRVGQGKDQYDIHKWEDRPVPAAGVLYDFEELFFVPEGHRVIVAFYGTTVGDRLNVWIDGYTTEKVITGRPDRPRTRER